MPLQVAGKDRVKRRERCGTEAAIGRGETTMMGAHLVEKHRAGHVAHLLLSIPAGHKAAAHRHQRVVYRFATSTARSSRSKQQPTLQLQDNMHMLPTC